MGRWWFVLALRDELTACEGGSASLQVFLLREKVPWIHTESDLVLCPRRFVDTHTFVYSEEADQAGADSADGADGAAGAVGC